MEVQVLSPAQINEVNLCWEKANNFAFVRGLETLSIFSPSFAGRKYERYTDPVRIKIPLPSTTSPCTVCYRASHCKHTIEYKNLAVDINNFTWYCFVQKRGEEMTTCTKCFCLLEKGHSYVDPEIEPRPARVQSDLAKSRTGKFNYELNQNDFIKFGNPRCSKHRHEYQVRLDILMILRQIRHDEEHRKVRQFFAGFSDMLEFTLKTRLVN